MSARLQTIDAETLLATPLKPVPFVVDGLVPCGLHILAGSPKIGKSWLVLWLCMKVTSGEPVWERTANRCGVLYLCLEDTFNRIQNRLFEITDAAPANLHFAVMTNQIGAGLQQQIEYFLKHEPEARLIVIDCSAFVEWILQQTPMRMTSVISASSSSLQTKIYS